MSNVSGYNSCARTFTTPLFCAASFYGGSYIRIPYDDASRETDVKLHFRTYRPDGLLFLAAGSPDFCLIRLTAGAIHVQFDLGSGVTLLSSPPGVLFNDVKWHQVHVTRKENHVQLKVTSPHTKSTVDCNINNTC